MIFAMKDRAADVFKEHADKQDYWLSELESLGIEPKRKNELNDREELQALAENIKEVYYQDYKTIYGDKVDESSFDYII